MVNFSLDVHLRLGAWLLNCLGWQLNEQPLYPWIHRCAHLARNPGTERQDLKWQLIPSDPPIKQLLNLEPTNEFNMFKNPVIPNLGECLRNEFGTTTRVPSTPPRGTPFIAVPPLQPPRRPRRQAGCWNSSWAPGAGAAPKHRLNDGRSKSPLLVQGEPIPSKQKWCWFIMYRSSRIKYVLKHIQTNRK